MLGDNLFVGSAINVADAKGRFALPLEMRRLVRAASGNEGRLCTSIPDLRGCAIGFGLSYQADKEREIVENARLAAHNGRDYDANAEREAFFPLIEYATFDDGGRFFLSDDVKVECGITDAVLFVGVSQFFQIWDPARYVASDAREGLIKNKVRRFLEERKAGGK